MMFLLIFMIFSMIYCIIRLFLENDAMLKARYLAKDYLEEKAISSKEEIEKLVAGFDKINAAGIKCIHYLFFRNVMMKLFILVILAFVF